MTHSKLPARTTSHKQDAQSQRRSAFERLGPNGSQNREKRRNHTQSKQIELPGEERSRASHHSSPRFIPRLNNSWLEGAESEHREVGTHDRFPCFQDNLLRYGCLTSSNHQTTPNTMGRLNQNSGSESTRNQLN
jgi:hypothetical protein